MGESLTPNFLKPWFSKSLAKSLSYGWFSSTSSPCPTERKILEAICFHCCDQQSALVIGPLTETNASDSLP
ncbi:hypothetical protein Tsubulata_041547 [Turnera subulata]|uniref:Uncharacterized protein n=1 Tax=Turnera subulata TaxID=218843 RepID=A0A9Q0FZG5_9ROSI|nr:hypothetical protein Tsubulata_041547 [Turnera subulata]